MYDSKNTIEKKTIPSKIEFKKYTCKICNQSYMHPENLDLHYKEYHEKNERCNFFNIFKKCA